MMRRWLAFGAVCLALGAWDIAQRSPMLPAQALTSQVPSMALPTAAPLPDVSALRLAQQGQVPMPAGALAAHASSLLAMPADSPASLFVFWFSGERESGPQVQIAFSALDRKSHTWSAPRFVVNRHTVADTLGFGVRRIGNPVAWRDADGRIHLFVVATGWGGWAAGRILHLQQRSAGPMAAQDPAALAFEPVRVLPLSWLWNTSYLVRNAPLPLADGGMVLPVYFELGIQTPTALRFGPQGQFMGMVRMSAQHHGLQPALIAQSPTQWLALLRDTRPDGKIGVVQTTDAGQHWHDLPDLPMHNPDSSVAALALAPQQWLLAHNPNAQGRAQLDLSYSRDGLHWATLHTLAQGAPSAEFSYPAMAWADNSLWVSYTVDRHYLAWQQFTAPAAATTVSTSPVPSPSVSTPPVPTPPFTPTAP